MYYSLYNIYLSLRIEVSNTYCVVFFVLLNRHDITDILLKVG